jgi:DNA topoisomerase-3
MKVYLCEKPDQGRTFAKALGVTQRGAGCLKSNDIIVTWCIGHLIQQWEPKEYDEKYKQWDLSHLPIIPKTWKMKKTQSTASQYEAVCGILKNLTANDTVYISTDADSEGELIGVEMLEHTNCKAQRKRIINTSLDDISLRESLADPRNAEDTYPDYLSALARSRADWISGMNLTIAISAVNRGKIEGFFSVGRVQTPTLSLIVTRDLFIENFKPKNYYDLKGVFDINSESVEAKWKAPKEECEEGKYYTNEDAIKAIKAKIQGKDGIVSKYEKSLKKKGAPLGFGLSDIYAAASSKFGYSAASTLKIMQSLYDTHKICSYPRTDSQYIPPAMKADISVVLEAIGKTDPQNSNLQDILGRCDKKKSSKIWKKDDSAHHAIIPTRVPGNINKLSTEEKNMYEIVRNRYVAQFLPDYEFYSSKIDVTIEGEVFEVSGNVPHIQGWRDIEGKSNESSVELPVLNKNDIAHCKSAKIENKKTKPPSYYTDGTIIIDMKNIGKFIEDPKMRKLVNDSKGIGTEATRANILETLEKRGFIKKQKKHVISTEKGRALISISPKYLKDPEMSAYWEQDLDNISKKTQTFEKFMAQQEKMLNKILIDVNEGKCTLVKGIGFDYHCADCDDGLKKIKSKASGKAFWVHSAKGACNVLYTDNRGKPGDKIVPVEQGDVEHNCETCQTVLMKRKGDSSFYWACPNYKVCKAKTLPDDNGKPGVRKERVIAKTDHKCPDCKPGYLVKRESNRNNKTSVFWGCNNFPKCRHSAFDDNGSPKAKK